MKYFTWNTNQWISYDDKETFQQKLEWADGIGFSGSLIWASDQDTYNLDAHKAFTGNDNLGKLSVQAKAATSPTDVALELNGDLGTTCYVRKDKVDLNNPQASSCSPDIRVGYDNAGCNEKNASVPELDLKTFTRHLLTQHQYIGKMR